MSRRMAPIPIESKQKIARSRTIKRSTLSSRREVASQPYFDRKSRFAATGRQIPLELSYLPAHGYRRGLSNRGNCLTAPANLPIVGGSLAILPI